MLFKVSLQLTFPSQYLTLMLDTCTGKDAVQSRNQDQSQNSGNSQTTDYGNRHRTPHLRTLSTANCHRDHTENCSSSGHQYRTKTALTCCYDRIEHSQSTFAAKSDVVDKYNTILYNDTDQHDGSQEAHYTQRALCKEKRHQHSTEGKRQ